MLTLLRTNQLTFCVWLLPYAILLRLPIWFGLTGDYPTPVYGPAADWLAFLGSPSSTAYQIVILLLLWLQATYLNALHFKFRLSNEAHLFPGLFLILFNSAILPFFNGLELVLVQGGVLLVVSNLLHLYRENKPVGPLVNIGFWLGMTSILLPTSLLLIIFVFISLTTLRNFSLRERFMVVFGMLAVFILAGTGYFWNDQLPYFWEALFAESFGWFNFSAFAIPLVHGHPADAFWSYNISWSQLVFFMLLTGLVLVVNSSLFQRKNMAVQKRISVFYQLLLVIPLVVFFNGQISLLALLLLALPLAQLWGLFMGDLPKGHAEVIHLLLVLLVLGFQFYSLFIIS